MGSSSGGGSGAPPRTPPPPGGMIAPEGQTSPFSPQFINFLGDTNVPSTGLTPEMLAQIDAGGGSGIRPPGGGMGGGDRGMLAEIMARLDAMQKQGGGNRSQWERQMRQGNGGDRAGGAGYSTSGREGAGSFGSRSSSASRAGGGLY